MEPDATANYHSNLYVKGLPLDADEDQLVSLFGEHGDVQSVRIFRSMQAGDVVTHITNIFI